MYWESLICSLDLTHYLLDMQSSLLLKNMNKKKNFCHPKSHLNSRQKESMVLRELPEVSTDHLPNVRYKTTGEGGKKEDSLWKEGTEVSWENEQNWSWQSLKVTE